MSVIIPKLTLFVPRSRELKFRGRWCLSSNAYVLTISANLSATNVDTFSWLDLFHRITVFESDNTWLLMNWLVAQGWCHISAYFLRPLVSTPSWFWYCICHLVCDTTSHLQFKQPHKPRHEKRLITRVFRSGSLQWTSIRSRAIKSANPNRNPSLNLLLTFKPHCWSLVCQKCFDIFLYRLRKKNMRITQSGNNWNDIFASRDIAVQNFCLKTHSWHIAKFSTRAPKNKSLLFAQFLSHFLPICWAWILNSQAWIGSRFSSDRLLLGGRFELECHP